jgi:hypothetical protein
MGQQQVVSFDKAKLPTMIRIEMMSLSSSRCGLFISTGSNLVDLIVDTTIKQKRKRKTGVSQKIA